MFRLARLGVLTFAVLQLTARSSGELQNQPARPTGDRILWQYETGG